MAHNFQYIRKTKKKREKPSGMINIRFIVLKPTHGRMENSELIGIDLVSCVELVGEGMKYMK